MEENVFGKASAKLLRSRHIVIPQTGDNAQKEVHC